MANPIRSMPFKHLKMLHTTFGYHKEYKLKMFWADFNCKHIVRVYIFDTLQTFLVNIKVFLFKLE